MPHSDFPPRFRIFRQTWITRDDLKANREIVYVYGDNAAREGRRGLARQMRGEPNAHPISISWGPHEPFTHATADKACERIDADLTALRGRGATLIIWPLLGLVPEFQTMPDDVRAHLRAQVRKLFAIDEPG